MDHGSAPSDKGSIRSVILIVEDETLPRLYLGEVLERAGYQVVSAANANEAIEILRATVSFILPLSENGVRQTRPDGKGDLRRS
jgi:DNA-binding NtrC family response regulator